MTDLLIFLALWLIPWFICCVLIYYDMDKHQSIESYLAELGFIKVIISCPFLNILAMLALIAQMAEQWRNKQNNN